MKQEKIVINNNKPSIIERIKFWIILVISFYTFILISYNAINLFLEFNHQSEQIITQETERQKKIAKNAVNEAIDLIELHLEFLKNTKYPNRDISELFSNEFLQANFPPQSENELIQKDIKKYQNILLERISKIRFGKNNYVFINNTQGDALITQGHVKNDGEKLWEIDKNNQNILKPLFKKQLSAFHTAEGKYINYKFPKPNNPDEFLEKTSFVKGVHKIGWIVGAGVYKEDIDSLIIRLRKKMQKKFLISFRNILIFYLLLLILTRLLIHLALSQVSKDIRLIVDFFHTLSPNSEISHLSRESISFKETDEIANSAMKMHLARLEAEKELFRDKAELLVTLNSIQNAIIVTDANGKIILMNKTAISYCNDFHEENITKIGEFYKSSNNKKIINPVLELLKSGQNITQPYGYSIRTASGKLYQISYSASILKNTNDKIFGAVLVFQDISNDYKLKEELKQSRKRYQQLLHTTSEGFFQLDTNYNIIDLNETFCKMLKKERWEIIGSNLAHYLSKLSKDKNDELSIKTRNNENVSIEVDISKDDDEPLYVLINASPLYDVNNNLGYFGFITDITKLKHIEKALQDSEKYLLSIFNTMTDILLELDNNGKYLFIAPTFPDVLLKPADELLGNYIHDVMNKTVADKILNAIQNTLSSNKITKIKYTLTINNNSVWFEATIAPKTSSSVLFIARDITEQELAKAKLIASEQRYKYLFDQSPVSIWEEDFSEVKKQLDQLAQNGVTDFRQYFQENPKELKKYSELVKIIDVNQKTLTLFSATDKEDFLQNLASFFNEEAEQKFINHLCSIAKNEIDFSQESINVTMDGRIINVLIHSNVVPGFEHDYSKVLVSLLDITEQKQKDRQIAIDLEEKKTLIKELYHRTKNNMQVISSMLLMQSMRTKNQYVKDTFRDINNKIQAMSLVHKKLYQSKNLSKINLKDYISDLVELLLRSYQVKNDHIEVIYDLDDVYILMDSAIPLGLCINELVTNSFKYAFNPEEKGRIFISLQKFNESINLRIADTGNKLDANYNVLENSSMGLQTVVSLIQNQIKGKINFKIDGGLIWEISFKDNLNTTRV
jgi:PAS domain S-box-containing protein